MIKLYNGGAYLVNGTQLIEDNGNVQLPISKEEAAKKEDINLVNIPIRHLGTEKSHELYKKIQDYLLANNVEIMFDTNVIDLTVENNKITGVKVQPSVSTDPSTICELSADKVVLGIGRKGANWLSEMCSKHSIKNRAGVVDVGVRYELPDSVMKDVNEYLYEGKFVEQHVDEANIDLWFDQVTKKLNDAQRVDLKNKWSSIKRLTSTDARIKRIALDINQHFIEGYKNTGFKAMLACNFKKDAVRYQKIGNVIGQSLFHCKVSLKVIWI